MSDLDPAQAILNHKFKVLFIFSQYKLDEIGSLLKAKLMKKIKKLEGYMWRFGRSVSICITSGKAPWNVHAVLLKTTPLTVVLSCSNIEMVTPVQFTHRLKVCFMVKILYLGATTMGFRIALEWSQNFACDHYLMWYFFFRCSKLIFCWKQLAGPP